MDKFKIQVGAVTEENRRLRQASVNIQARAEQEEEFISNTLLKKIQELKKEKVMFIKWPALDDLFTLYIYLQETLAIHYEKEEEFLTNQLSKKLGHLRQEKVELEVRWIHNNFESSSIF